MRILGIDGCIDMKVYQIDTRALRAFQVNFMLTKSIADEATNQNFQVARLQIDSRKWVASKLTPHKYGDKTSIDHTSSDESMKQPTIIQLVGKVNE